MKYATIVIAATLVDEKLNERPVMISMHVPAYGEATDPIGAIIGTFGPQVSIHDPKSGDKLCVEDVWPEAAAANRESSDDR